MALTQRSVVDRYRKRAKRYDWTARLYWLIGFAYDRYRGLAIDALDLDPGDTVIDVGCGTGLNSLSIEKRVGPTGRIDLVRSDAAAFRFAPNVDGVAVAAVLVGVAFEPARGAHGALPAGSFLFAALYQLAGDGPLMTPVELGPIGFAGWLGLLVTALNLVPIGQLDGGHMAYAVLGRRQARLVSGAMVALMVLAGFLVSSHWLMWAVLVWALVGIGHPPAENDLVPLGPGRTLLGLFALALFLSIVLPWPA